MNLLKIETANSVSKLINFDVLYELLFKPLKKKADSQISYKIIPCFLQAQKWAHGLYSRLFLFPSVHLSKLSSLSPGYLPSPEFISWKWFMNLQGGSLWQNSQIARKMIMTGNVPKHRNPDAIGKVSLDHNKHVHNIR